MLACFHYLATGSHLHEPAPTALTDKGLPKQAILVEIADVLFVLKLANSKWVSRHLLMPAILD